MSSNLFIAADHHFEHLNIIKTFQFRPFADCAEMEEELILRHNARVAKGDRVVFIGDMFWRHCTVAHADQILSRMNGQKHYVFGNHEETGQKVVACTSHFITASESYKVDLEPYGYKEARYLFCAHFAHRVWPRSHLGTWHAYGHSHGALRDDPTSKSMDVGVDTNDYYPYSIEQFANCMRAKEDTYVVTPASMKRGDDWQS
jgi:calcineurin-like phosphoesterase family protein